MITATSTTGREDILAALRQASAETGTDFDYLLSTAKRESSLQADAKSKTSSASGLFQFIDQTWLGLMKRYGADHGLGNYAAAIDQGSNGRCTVASAEAKQAILALRQDPKVSALMAGEAANETSDNLQDSLGRVPCAGELYLAHFLGPNAATKLISANDADPTAAADQMFPQAANANRHVFYNTDGTPKSVGDVYNWATKSGTGGNTAIAATSVPARAHPAWATTNSATAIAFKPKTMASNLTPADMAEFDSFSDHGGADNSRSSFAMSWNPNTPFTPASTLPQPPLMMSSGLVEILAAMGGSYGGAGILSQKRPS